MAKKSMIAKNNRKKTNYGKVSKTNHQHKIQNPGTSPKKWACAAREAQSARPFWGFSWIFDLFGDFCFHTTL